MNGEKMPSVCFKILCLLLNEGCNTHQAIKMLEDIIRDLKEDARIE